MRGQLGTGGVLGKAVQHIGLKGVRSLLLGQPIQQHRHNPYQQALGQPNHHRRVTLHFAGQPQTVFGFVKNRGEAGQQEGGGLGGEHDGGGWHAQTHPARTAGKFNAKSSAQSGKLSPKVSVSL